MASPVDTSVKFFSSTMVGAPVLTRAAGSLIALLDALLVNGFNALTLTSLNVSNGIATAGFNGTFAGVAGSVAEISGATGAYDVLNGQQKLISAGAGFVTFATAAASGSAAGTLGMKMAPAGWTKPFAGTNLAAFRSGDPIGNRLFLRISDAAGKTARAVGYETMTAISTGTGLFPTAAQLSGGQHWSKSMSEDNSATPWFVIGNAKRFYFCPAPCFGTYSAGYYDGKVITAFGEFVSLKPGGDGYGTFIAGNDNADSPYSTLNTLQAGANSSTVIARGHTGAAGAKFADWISPSGNSSGYQSGRGFALLGPLLGVMGRLVLIQNYLAIDPATLGPRGMLPELLLCPQAIDPTALLNADDFVPGVGAMAGRKLLAVGAVSQPQYYQVNDGSSKALVFFDTTGPWQ